MSISMFENEPDKIAIAADDFLFREGDDPDFLYVLLSGQARILVGKREVERLDVGMIVGEAALIERAPRMASVQATTECVFARIDKKRFLFLISETPGFALTVMRTLSKRLRGADRVIEAND